MAKCLVTGGAGFIGHHLVKELLRQGHEVAILDHNPNILDTVGIIHFVSDICDIVSYEFEIGELDVIFHLAAVSRTVPAINDPVECIRTNVLGTVAVLEAARQAKVPRVVVSSSNVVYAGATPYRDSKRSVEELCRTYIELYDQSVIGLRYSNVYGPGIPQGDPAVFAMLRDSFRTRCYAEVTGTGEQTRDFTHVSDIVAGNIAAWHSDSRGMLDLCTGVQTSINAVCEMLSIPIQYVPERPGDIFAMVQDKAPAKSILGWESTISIEEGIQSIWQI